MSTSQISAKAAVFPYELKFTNKKLYAIVAIFVALDVAIPWLFHMVHPMAGPTFLPMFFLILLAGIIFGWRAGILVGMLTPLVSYSICGMPAVALLPRILVEGTIYGLAAGLLYERLGRRVLWATVGAIILGRIATMLAIFIIHSGAINPVAIAWKAAKVGWPGIAVQIILLPLIAIFLERTISRIRETDERP